MLVLYLFLFVYTVYVVNNGKEFNILFGVIMSVVIFGGITLLKLALNKLNLKKMYPDGISKKEMDSLSKEDKEKLIAEEKRKKEVLSGIKKWFSGFNEQIFISSAKFTFDEYVKSLKDEDFNKLEYYCSKNYLTSGKYKDFDYTIFAKLDSAKDYNFIIEDFSEEKKSIKVQIKYEDSIYKKAYSGEIRGSLKELHINFVTSEAGHVDVMHCPNCNAPLNDIHDRVCSFCKKDITIRKYWIIDAINNSK